MTVGSAVDADMSVNLRHGASGRTFGACSTVALVCRYPKVVSCTVLRHPRKTTVLLRHTEVDAITHLLRAVPVRTAKGILRELLDDVSRENFFNVVAPLLNCPQMRDSLIVVLTKLEPRHIVAVVNNVPVEKLAIIMAAPPDALAATIFAIEPHRLDDALVPILQESESLLRDTIVQLLRRHPEHLGTLINKAELRILLWMLRGVRPDRMIALVAEFEARDVEAGSTLVRFLEITADDPQLVDEKVLPLLNQAEAKQLIPFLRGVTAEQLLAVLRRVDADGIVRLLESTNTELAVQVCNGPLDEGVLGNVVDGLSDVLRNPVTAQAFKHATDALNVFSQGLQGAVQRGKDFRGANDAAPYQFGDVARGLLSALNDPKIDEHMRA